MLALLVTGVALACAGVAVLQVPAGAQGAARVSSSDVVVVQPDSGNIVSLTSENKTDVLQSGLEKPTGVTALADGAVLAAEFNTGRIVGFGGRFADGVTVAEKLTRPQALTTGSDGTVFVASGNGELGKLDLAKEQAQRYTKITDGLKDPQGLVEKGGVLLVAEAGAGTITQISATGEKLVVAKDLQQPVGVAVGPGRMLFVSEAKTNKVTRIDEAGVRTPFADVDGPQQLAVNPFQPEPNAAYTVAVAARDALLVFDRDGKRLYTEPGLKGVRGVSAVPASEPGKAGDLEVPTTRARSSGGPSFGRDDELAGPTTSTYALVVSLVILGGLGIFAVVMFFIHEPKGSAQAGFEERPLDETVFEVFGPCANEEVELAEAEGGLRSIATQRQQAERQAREASRRASAARDRANRAHHAKQKAGRARAARARAGQREPVPGLRTEELRLRSRGGNEALAAFRSGEIDAAELEERWRDLGEKDALECVQVIGVVVAAQGALSIDEVKAGRAEERAREELERAEEGRREAAREIERLREREVQAVKRIRDARRELDGCQQRAGGRQRGGRRGGRRGDSGAPPARPTVGAPEPSETSPTRSEPVPVGAQSAPAAAAATPPPGFPVAGVDPDPNRPVPFRPPMVKPDSGRTRPPMGTPDSGRTGPPSGRTTGPIADPRGRDRSGRTPKSPLDEAEETTQVRFRPQQGDASPTRSAGWSAPAGPRPAPARPPGPPSPPRVQPPRAASPPPPPPPPAPPSYPIDGPDSVAGFLWSVEPPRGEGPQDRTGERPRPSNPRGGPRSRPPAAEPGPTTETWDAVWPAVPRADRAVPPRTPAPGPSLRTPGRGPRPVNGTNGMNGVNGANGRGAPSGRNGSSNGHNGTNGAHGPVNGNAATNGWTDDWVPPPPPFEPLWPQSARDWTGEVPATPVDPPYPPDHLNGNGRPTNGRARRDDPPQGYDNRRR